MRVQPLLGAAPEYRGSVLRTHPSQKVPPAVTHRFQQQLGFLRMVGLAKRLFGIGKGEPSEIYELFSVWYGLNVGLIPEQDGRHPVGLSF